MALKITTNTDQPDRRLWEEFVNAHPDGNVFQMPWMFDLYGYTHRQHPSAFFAYEEGQLVGILLAVHLRNSMFPLSYVTNRQLVVGGPLVKDNDMGVLLALLEALIKSDKWSKIYTEIRNLRLGLSMKPVFEEAGFYYESYLSIVVDLNKTGDELWASLSPERQENILRLKKTEYTITDIEGEQQIKTAWQVIRRSIGQKGRPVPHRSLFMTGFDLKELKPHLKIKGLMVENKLQGAIVLLILGSNAYVYYEGNVLSSMDSWMYDGFMWGVMQELQSQGVLLLNMGTGGRPGHDFYARQYKKSYGGMIKETGRYIYIHNWGMWNLGRFLYRWYKRIRVFLFNNII